VIGEREPRERENRGMVMVSCFFREQGNGDGVLLLQRTGEWLERTESEQGKKDNRERTINDRRERMNSETRKPRGMRGMGGFQKLNEGNQRGIRGEFEKLNEETD